MVISIAVLNGRLWLNSTTQHARSRKCERLLPTNFSIFTLKNVTCWTYLISFTVQYCFLFRFVCIELVALICVLQIWVVIYVYGTMINWSSLIKKFMQMYIVIVSGSILKHFHCLFEWHLTPHMTLSIETCIRGHPVQHSPILST